MQKCPKGNWETNNPVIKTTTYDPVIKSAGNWFYWIAGLSIINSVIVLAHGDIEFVVGLGVTQIFDYAVKKGSVGALFAIPMNLVIAGSFILFGYFACRHARWAFIIGIVFYVLDTLFVLAAKEWFMVAFHVFALVAISRGLSAISMARKSEQNL